MIYRKACIGQVSSGTFCSSIPQLPYNHQLLTIWLSQVGLYSSTPEIAFILML
jgi:hypothetical protein